ncbi:MAG: helix-turn-helix domain-containing protein [Thermodesulfobacteriota bacterium]
MASEAPKIAVEAGSTATRILDAAEALFAERGFAGVSVREIAGRVGLNQASIYNHFPSKQALYEAVLERGLQPILDLLADGAAALRTESERDRLLEQLVEHLWHTPHLPKLIQREVLDGGEYLERLADHWLKPIYEQGRQAVLATPGVVDWPEQDLPLLILGMYHLLFGHFSSAALLERLVGQPALSPAMKRAHLAFVKRASERLLRA